MAAVKLADVRTSNGESATLLFSDVGIYVLDRSERHSRLFRISGTAIFAAIAVAAASIGVGHTVNVRLGQWLSFVALVLGVGSAAVAAVAWVMSKASERRLRTGAPALTAGDVRWARSTDERGRIVVTLGVADGTTREFSAQGMTGVHLARQFGTLLGIEPERATIAAAGTAE